MKRDNAGLTENKAEGVAEWRLAPDEAGGEYYFGSPVYVTSSNPCGCEEEEDKTLDNIRRYQTDWLADRVQHFTCFSSLKS